MPETPLCSFICWVGLQQLQRFSHVLHLRCYLGFQYSTVENDDVLSRVSILVWFPFEILVTKCPNDCADMGKDVWRPRPLFESHAKNEGNPGVHPGLRFQFGGVSGVPSPRISLSNHSLPWFDILFVYIGEIPVVGINDVTSFMPNGPFFDPKQSEEHPLLCNTP